MDTLKPLEIQTGPTDFALVRYCFNTYCIHEKDAHCQLRCITLNDQGVCDQCRMVMPEENDAVLQYRKEQAKKKKPGVFI